ncbi:MAG: T9SS C-terminal target domain-containing protein, partial [Calditrichaeota bacterium]
YIYMAVAAEVPGIGYYLMILNNDGTPLFSRELLSDYAYDFKVQPNGLMSYAQFLEHHSYTGGGDVIHMVMDNSFTVIDSFQMGNGYIAEAHDFQILPNGHALLFGYYLTQVDMSQIVQGGYPNALVSGGVVQELDVNKNVVFQWRSWDHYDFATYPFGRFATRPIVSEFHLNTINLDRDGHIFIATPSWAKKINRQTGEIIWNLGDFDNDFSFIGVDSLVGLDYVGGHTFHRIPNGHVLLYDNGNRQGTRSSQVHEFILDENNFTAELFWSYVPDSTIAAWHRGSAQRLPNGNTVIGWGGASGDYIPACTEVTPAGLKVYEISFDNPLVESYRAFRIPFPDGQPAANVTITEVAQGNTYLFNEGDTNRTGISVRINSLSGSGYNDMTVKKYNYAPFYPQFPGKAPRVKPLRMVISGFNINTITADVMFDAAEWEIQYPDSAIIYQREFEGSGLFIPLNTTYNHVTGKVVANTDRMGEFVVTYPDLESVVFTPMAYAPEDSGTVNQELPVTLRWTPIGQVNEYDIQIASDFDFTSIIINQGNMTDAFFTMDTVTKNTDYYWRVRATNPAGTSDWTTPQLFTTVAPYVTMTIPNGGENWQIGLEYFIKWEDNLAENVILELHKSQSLVSVIDTTESNGAYRWEIPVTLIPGTDYYVQVKSMDVDSLADSGDNPFALIDTTSVISDKKNLAINGYYLKQNYPNPFNPSTTIEYAIPKSSRVKIRIYSTLGSEVRILKDELQPAGRYSIIWDGRDNNGNVVSNGLYFYRMETGLYSRTMKMLYIK